MSDREILEDIVYNYGSRRQWQSDLGAKYGVKSSVISEILQLCGFHYGKRKNVRISDEAIVDEALKNPEIVGLCEKLRQEKKKSNRR